MNTNFSKGIIIPTILFGALLGIALITIYIGLNTPKDPEAQVHATETIKPASTQTPLVKEEKSWHDYYSETTQIAFSFPENLEITEETRHKLVLDEEIIFSTLESVPIHKLRLCEFVDSGECLFEKYANQTTTFVNFDLDEKKAKSFYYRDADGKIWHVVSLSVYEEFQIMLPAKYDKYYEGFINTFDFLDNNEE